MKALVIGYGSIGSRHARILNEFGYRVSVVSEKDIDFPLVYKDIKSALNEEDPDYVIIANRTSEHYDSLTELANHPFTGIVLVEKPLFHEVKEIPFNQFRAVYIGYNLRFHPIIQKLHQFLKGEKIISVQAYVGQYLPTWRPGIDYKLSYSARHLLGGGAIRDLSHELDYLNWLLEGWISTVALGGHYSHLDIDSDDVFNVFLEMRLCPIVNIQVNYLDRIGRREVIINTDKNTIKVDLFKNILQINEEIIKYKVDYDQTYNLQHKAILSGNNQYLCSSGQALETLKLIEAAEQSAKLRKWMYR